MKKRLFLTLVTASLLLMSVMTGCGNAAPAGPADINATTKPATSSEGTVYKVGIVKYVDDASLDQIEANIMAELDAKGAELGVTFNYADYTHDGQADATVLNQIATDLVADEVDIIIPIATPAAMIMQAATEDNNIPVIFSAVSDPVGAGLVASMDAPGANISGTSDAIDTKTIIDLILAAKPEAAKIGLLYDKSQAGSIQSIEDAKAYLDSLNIAYVEKTGTNASEVQAAADSLVAEGVDAVFTPQDNTIMTAELSIFEKFTEAKILHFTGADSFALNGAFMGYGCNYADLGKQTADMAVAVLTGDDISTMPVGVLSQGIITINTQTADACGIDASIYEGQGSEVVTVETAESFN
ncbi:MAG: ABC transporter substrate-binding protein [Pseudobutyrivibrio sp.]|nr:ABC transporter substrate-binding protein [Pseudobutyrivibrio sp.]